MVTHGRSMSSPTSPSSLPTSTEPAADLRPAQPFPLLIRATDGKSKAHRADKIKLSTVVNAERLEAFYVRYAEVCRVGMQALKKRDRSGRKKAKTKKRKAGAT
ncbi:MAG: hypothetical protein M1838_002758 [Thelocarpon superellum]|nr:MAG: hypothetical protein M1838_002758 [Thelocarpon superellum]